MLAEDDAPTGTEEVVVEEVKSKKSKPKPKPKAKAPVKTKAPAKAAVKVAAKAPAKPKKAAAPKASASTSISQYREAAEFLKMFAEPSRVAIASLLAQENGETVGQLAEMLELSQPALSHHLALMRHTGVIEAQREGKTIRYSLSEKGSQVYTALAVLLD